MVEDDRLFADLAISVLREHSLAHRHESKVQRPAPPNRARKAHCSGFQDLRRPTDVQGHANHGMACFRTT